MNLEQLNQHPLLTLHCDGRVTVTDKLRPEETAKLVLDQIKTKWMDDAQATKIRELEREIDRLNMRILSLEVAGQNVVYQATEMANSGAIKQWLDLVRKEEVKP